MQGLLRPAATSAHVICSPASGVTIMVRPSTCTWPLLVLCAVSVFTSESMASMSPVMMSCVITTWTSCAEESAAHTGLADCRREAWAASSSGGVSSEEVRVVLVSVVSSVSSVGITALGSIW